MSQVEKRRGRPTAYRPEYCERIVELMRGGRSLDGCAALLGVHPNSLANWQHEHAEFAEAVIAGRAAATAFWEDRLLDVAQGKPGNAQAITWALRNRSRAAAGWHADIQRLEHSGPDGGRMQVENSPAIDVSRLTTDERMALRALLEKAIGQGGQVNAELRAQTTLDPDQR